MIGPPLGAPYAWSPLAVLWLFTWLLLPICHTLGARSDLVWPLGLVSCTVWAVCLGCPNANLHIPDVSTNNLRLDKPVTSH